MSHPQSISGMKQTWPHTPSTAITFHPMTAGELEPSQAITIPITKPLPATPHVGYPESGECRAAAEPGLSETSISSTTFWIQYCPGMKAVNSLEIRIDRKSVG